MSLYAKLLGTLEAIFHIGGTGGPAIKRNGAGLQTRLANDTSFALHEALTPVLADPASSLVTKAYVAGEIAALYPALDSLFSVGATADLTRLFRLDASGQAAGTTTTVFLGGTVSRPFRLPDISGTALVAQDSTQFVFIGGPTTQLHGSNAGIQYSTVFPGAGAANRAQTRYNLYGANSGTPGVTGFKSRGATIGSLAGCLAGDLLFRATAIGVCPDNVSLPLAGFITIQVPAAFVPAGQSFLPAELEVRLASFVGPINSIRPVFMVTSEGETQTFLGVRAGGATVAASAPNTNFALGALWSSGSVAPNGSVVGSPGDLYTDTTGGAGATLWVKESGIATNTGWIPK